MVENNDCGGIYVVSSEEDGGNGGDSEAKVNCSGDIGMTGVVVMKVVVVMVVMLLTEL